MDIHHKILYGAMSGVVVAIGALGYHDMPAESVAFDTVPFGKHSYVVYAAPGALGDANGVAKAIRAHGGTVKIETDSNEHIGLWVAPKGNESDQIAGELGKLTGEPVVVDDYAAGEKAYGTPYQIGVGIPPSK